MTIARMLERTWKVWEILAAVGLAVAATLTALGWTFQRPETRLLAIETKQVVQGSAITKLEYGQGRMESTLETIIRLQCLQMTRRDADVAGACANMKVRDDLDKRR